MPTPIFILASNAICSGDDNNIYKPKVSKSDYGKKTINSLVKGYFEGSPAKLVSQFVSDNKLSVEELEALLEQIRLSKNNNP